MNECALAIIRLYKLFVSPVFRFLGAECRFHPTCSSYAVIAFTKFSFFKASQLTVTRLLKCGPWCEGGIDNL